MALRESSCVILFSYERLSAMKTTFYHWSRVLVAIGLFLAGLGESLGAPSDAEKAAKTDAEAFAWSIRSYRIPGDILATGFVSQEKGQLNLPKMPPSDAKDEEIQSYIKRSSAVLDQFFKKQGVFLPEGSLAVLDVEHEVLAVRTTGELHGQLSLMEESYRNNLPKMLAFRVDVLEAETAEVSKVMNDAASSADHGPLLDRLEAQVAAGRGKMLSTTRADTKSGQRVTINNATHWLFGTESEINEKGSSGTSARESRQVGTIVELDPVLGSDGRTIDVNYSLEYHLAPPTVRQSPVAFMDNKRVEMPVVDFHVAEATSSLAMVDGQCRLLGVWHPADVAAGTQVVGFLTAKVVPLLAAASPLAEKWMEEQAEKVVATPPVGKAKADDAGVVSGMIVRRFRVPPDWLSQRKDSAAPADPFATGAAPPASEPTFQIKATVLDILRAKGIPFPEGSSANYNPALSELIVRNLPQNMEFVEAYLRSLTEWKAKDLVFLLHIVQADGAVMRKLDRTAMGLADQTGMWSELEKEIAAGRATMVRQGWIETKSGQRSRSLGGTEYIYSSEASVSDGRSASSGNGTDKPSATATASSTGGLQSAGGAFEMEMVGLTWETDAVLGADGATIDLSLSVNLDTAPPTERFERPVNDIQTWRVDSPEVDFHKGTVQTAITTRSGMKRLIGIWKPKGTPELEKADVLQAVFIEARILTVE